ncbi:entericidin EcnAB [Arcobacter sp. FWKO B]|uniref:entericidin EcnAB n=1 Tax=Arcobacter sp. FWKO B TaxID=2593672 RepID=UPI001907080C|nr:entericidin EcnAB [Arcobacter sp. FWKO B]
MKRLIPIFFILVILQGCATWQGVKQDSSDAWEVTKETSSKVYNSTKKTIHEATKD